MRPLSLQEKAKCFFPGLPACRAHSAQFSRPVFDASPGCFSFSKCHSVIFLFVNVFFDWRGKKEAPKVGYEMFFSSESYVFVPPCWMYEIRNDQNVFAAIYHTIFF
jgi:hypothetical protein